MRDDVIAKPEDFRRAVVRANVERVELPSGLAVLLCRPPVFAALGLGQTGTRLQAKITDAKPDEVRTEDIEEFTHWITGTLTRLFVQPRFSATPGDAEIGLGDILIEDLKFIFRWLRGEVFGTGTEDWGLGAGENPSTQSPASSPCTEDLGRFPGGQGTNPLPGGSGTAHALPSQPTAGAHRHAGLSAGLHRG